jgi:hypothetical protein
VSFGSKLALAAAYGAERPLIFLDDDPSLVKTLQLPRPGVEVWLLRTPYTGEVDLGACRLFPEPTSTASVWAQMRSALLERISPPSPEI